MTRVLRIISMEQEGSERVAVITQLSSPGAPLVLEPGREMMISLHDGNQAVIVGLQALADLDHPALHGGLPTGKDGKPKTMTDDDRAQVQRAQEAGDKAKRDHELDQLRAELRDVTSQRDALWNGQGLTAEEIEFLKSRTAGQTGQALGHTAATDPNVEGGHAPRAIDPAIDAGIATNQGLQQDFVADANSNTPTAINAAGATKPTDPNADAPGALEAAKERQAIDAELKERDAASSAVRTNAEGGTGQSDLMPTTETTGLPGDRANADVGTPGNEDSLRRSDATPEDDPTQQGTGEASAPWQPFKSRTKDELIQHAESQGVPLEDGLLKDEVLRRVKDADGDYLKGLKKDELIAEAKMRGVEIDETETKAKIIARIEDAQ